MKQLQIVEHDGIRVITTQQLADVYGTDSKVISNNFNRNKERYQEGKHFVCLEGDDLKEFLRSSILGMQNKDKIRVLYLWTEKGAFLHAKSLNTDQAWDVYDRLVETYFKVRQSNIDREQLSPQMQMFYAIADGQAKMEMEQRRQAQKIAQVDSKVNNMMDIMTTPIGDWKAEINQRVREISIRSGIDYQSLYNQLYGELETTAHCSLKRLQENKVERMEKAGNTKTAIKDGTTKIAIIFEKPQLRAIFEGIVKRYAMAYCA